MNRYTDSVGHSSFARELGFFALYFVLIGMGLYTGLVIWREALYFVFYSWLPLDVFWARFLYMAAVVLGGFAVVVGLLIAEPYLNEGKRRGELVRRFLRAAAVILGLAIVGYIMLVIGRSTS